MVNYKTYTFYSVNANHTIYAEFEPDSESQSTTSIRMFIKEDGSWKPLFTTY